jgi:HD superfamily phosphodiesterase
MLRPQDEILWQNAKPYLDVRNNDEHTLFSYYWAKKLVELYPDSDADIILPAILFHDTGWKRIPKEKLFEAFGPNNKYPELTRQHELESVAIAQNELYKLNYTTSQIENISSIIDGHDTTKNQRSLNDAILKDADKLWRYTPHGNRIIGEWFGIEQNEVLEILENYVWPGFHTEKGKEFSKTMLDVAKLNLDLKKYL